MATVSQSADNVVALEAEKRQADSLWKIMRRRFFGHRMAVFGVFLLTVIAAYVVGGSFFLSEADANKTNLRARLEAPSAEYPFGTDEAGRNVLARTIYGGQISLAIGVVSVVISISMGTVVGLVAGYFGGLVDALLMRIVEALLAIPVLVLLLMLNRIFIEYNTSNVVILGRELSLTVVAIIIIIGFTGWMGLSRIVRSMVLSLKEQEFVLAARTMGAGSARIIFLHILPNCIAPIVVAATLGIGQAIIIETALSFLGFGVMPPTATWGNIIENARGNIDDWWWLWVFPGIFITVTVLSINFIGDGLRDALDPRSLK
jgi:peptide/nickel transport system permease protein